MSKAVSGALAVAVDCVGRASVALCLVLCVSVIPSEAARAGCDGVYRYLEEPPPSLDLALWVKLSRDVQALLKVGGEGRSRSVEVSTNLTIVFYFPSRAEATEVSRVLISHEGLRYEEIFKDEDSRSGAESYGLVINGTVGGFLKAFSDPVVKSALTKNQFQSADLELTDWTRVGDLSIFDRAAFPDGGKVGPSLLAELDRSRNDSKIFAVVTVDPRRGHDEAVDLTSGLPAVVTEILDEMGRQGCAVSWSSDVRQRADGKYTIRVEGTKRSYERALEWLPSTVGVEKIELDAFDRFSGLAPEVAAKVDRELQRYLISSGPSDSVTVVVQFLLRSEAKRFVSVVKVLSLFGDTEFKVKAARFSSDHRPELVIEGRVRAFLNLIQYSEWDRIEVVRYLPSGLFIDSADVP